MLSNVRQRLVDRPQYYKHMSTVSTGCQCCGRWTQVFHHGVIYKTGHEGSWMASVALVIIKHSIFPLTEELHSIMTDLTPQLSLSDDHMSVTSDPPHLISLLKPCCHTLSHSLYPCLCPRSCVCPPPPALDAAPGPEEELQSGAVLWGGRLWGGLSWAASGPGPERSQHAQRAGARVHLSTQGLRWEPAGCT